jgi:hypothetical protein
VLHCVKKHAAEVLQLGMARVVAGSGCVTFLPSHVRSFSVHGKRTLAAVADYHVLDSELDWSNGGAAKAEEGNCGGKGKCCISERWR